MDNAFLYDPLYGKEEEEEDYIDMDVSSFTHTITTNSKQFEFQMSEAIADTSSRARDYCFQSSSGLEKSKQKRCWSKNLKAMKNLSVGQKLKASRNYLKSLFSKPSFKKSCDKVRRENSVDGVQLKKHLMREEEVVQRRSFSGAINWLLSSKAQGVSSTCSSLSSSFSSAGSNASYRSRMMQRSNSVNSETEGSIQGAISYCKMSQQISEAGFSSF